MKLSKYAKGLSDLKKQSKEVLSKSSEVKKLGSSTGDLDLCLAHAQELCEYMNDHLLTRRNIQRVRLGRMKKSFLTKLGVTGAEIQILSSHFARAWHQTDNQTKRKTDYDHFMKREVIFNTIRQNLINLTLLEDYSTELNQRYGSTEHLISVRAFEIIKLLIAAAVGAISTIAVQHITNS